MNYRELRRLTELEGPKAVTKHVTEALAEKELKPEDFSIRELAEAVIPDGREYIAAMDPRRGGELVSESFDGVDVTAFLNITGQIIYTKILEGYQHEDFVLSRLVDTIPTRFDGEKIPGVTSLINPSSPSDEVQPGMPYQNLGFGERYVETPSTTKHGYIVPVTKEAIFFDRTALVLKNAMAVGETLGTNKEKRIADVVAGVVNPYSENGSAYNTYQAATPWINAITTNELLDWTDIEALEQLLDNILDPDSAEPLTRNQRLTVLVGPGKKHTARMILDPSSKVRRGDGASNTVQTENANPLDAYALAISKQLIRRLINSGVSASAAAKYTFLGDFKKAFAYMENWPITVVRAPNNSEAEFSADIVARFKASERGAAAVLNPRHVARTTGAT